jgi:hypothetical protein
VPAGGIGRKGEDDPHIEEVRVCVAIAGRPELTRCAVERAAEMPPEEVTERQLFERRSVARVRRHRCAEWSRRADRCGVGAAVAEPVELCRSDVV